MSRHPHHSRSGTATVELAIFLPLLFTLVIGSAELTSGTFLKESLTISTYEGCRVAIEEGATTPMVVARCQQILDDRNITGATITVSPAEVDLALSEEDVVVTITAPYANNIIFGGILLRGQSASAQCVMMKK